MLTNRRVVLIGLVSSFTTLPLFAQRRSPAPVWIDVVKVLADVGESLAAFSDSVGKIAYNVIRGHDLLERRAVKVALRKTSVKLSTVIADQQRVQAALDRYGDLWRKSYGTRHQISAGDRMELDRQWRISIATIKSIAVGTTAVLSEIRSFDSDIVLEESYGRLQEALSTKVGLLDNMARTPPPSNPDELKHLVDQEETFLHLRAEARAALKSVNLAIKSIKT